MRQRKKHFYVGKIKSKNLVWVQQKQTYSELSPDEINYVSGVMEVGMDGFDFGLVRIGSN